jgi:uncharacterized repeat protein (TIGR01451 family)
MNKTTALFAGILLSLFVNAQTPGIKWQRTFGGANREDIFYTIKTNDNAILQIGATFSTDGLFSSSHGLTDLWVEKLTLDGVTLWRKIMGGSGYEDLVSYYYNNTDGSVVISCITESVDGDVTGNHGSTDIWIVKLDANGNLVWQKSFGGTGVEGGGQIIKGNDGNYVVSGTTSSNDGDVTGFHGNGTDLWVIKFNESGNLLWQKALGGGDVDLNFRIGEFVYSPASSSDGSIYTMANVLSDGGDVTGHHGPGQTLDIWLVKLDASGNLIWQKSLGGNSDDFGSYIKLAPSGEIYLLGTTYSMDLPLFHGTDSTKPDLYFTRISAAGNILVERCLGSSSLDEATRIVSIDNSGNPLFLGTANGGDGDVVGFHGPVGKSDIWLFKTDINGVIAWQKLLGGTGNDWVSGAREDLTPPYGDDQTADGDIIQTSDQGYLLTAVTESKDGDVTGFHDGPPDPDLALTDLWVIKLNSDGQLEYTRSMGGTQFEYPGPSVEINPNDFIITGSSSSRDGDVQTNNGDHDGWIIRFGSINRIKGTVFIDQNGNGIKDAGDSLYSNVLIKATKGSDVRSAIPYNGSFVIETDTGSYNTALTLHLPYYTVTPVSHTSNFSTYFNTDSFSFALQPIPGSKDLLINAIPLSVARPGFNVSYVINYKNVGVLPEPSGEILFVKDPKLSLLNAVPPINSSAGDTLKWNYTGLDPQEHGTITLQFQIAAPPVANNGDTLTSLAIITPVAGDLTPHDDTSVLVQHLQGSYDPNDKAENVGASISLERVLLGEHINYFVRFQNTGTDTAFNVIVRDTLDADLDWNTFEMIASSHPYQLQLISTNILEWNFHGINLPDSNVNEPGSHGYIAYRIKVAPGSNIGTTILNRASIYFDFNLPVATNFAMTIVGTPILLPLHLLDFSARYQQPDARLEWSTMNEDNVDKFIIERGSDPIHFVPVGTMAAKGGSAVNRYEFKDGLASTSGNKFYYRLKMMDLDRKFTYSNIQLVSREGKSVNELVMNPNPVKGRTGFAWINLQNETMAEIGVMDMKGNYRSLGQQRINKGFNVIPLDFFGLSAGTYLLYVKTGKERLISRFVLVQ